MRTRTRAALLVTGLAATAAGLGAAPAGAADVAARVSTFERFGYTPGPDGGLVLNWGYDPARVSVPHGSTVRFAVPAGASEPHTVTVVRAADVPQTIDEIFNCGPCTTALQRHDPDGNAEPPFNALVNRGATGLDRQGDSRLIFPGASAFARVSAARGSTLHYVCAIHPWMQAEIEVT